MKEGELRDERRDLKETHNVREGGELDRLCSTSAQA
jgi:hypothetical protein